ncbi:hypothetical protein K443DRAFT_676860 [Laccaria amethystina LaAM-08-1]|uniref:Uncharacterized protein n=1 Tax=Laccaria amethystina LaAM-08-1 TaxID=1095629 RepID=A0A0C9WVC2_9AGAR|nr:hypothetical protein K443DRAFT_676860 [Laccaria amethystina LaAM-08-1]
MHGAAVEDDRILQEVIVCSWRRLCRRSLSAWASRQPDIRGNANQFISRSVTYVSLKPSRDTILVKTNGDTSFRTCIRCRHGLLPFR